MPSSSAGIPCPLTGYLWAIMCFLFLSNSKCLGITPVNQSVLCLCSAYTEPYKVCPVSVISMEVVTSDEEQKSSEDEESSPGDPSLINKVKEQKMGNAWNLEREKHFAEEPGFSGLSALCLVLIEKCQSHHTFGATILSSALAAIYPYSMWQSQRTAVLRRKTEAM